MTARIRIGTRKSRLAMWQTEWVAGLLRGLNPNIEVQVVPIQTLGDRDKGTALVSLGRTGVFTKELEESLLDDRCDLAVHSFKDMATAMPDGLALGPVLEREEPWDVLISRNGMSFEDLPAGSVVGTSSLRRKSLLLHNRSDLTVVDLRGNVPTRLRAVGVDMDDGKVPVSDSIDATIMALAGLKRLGLDSHATQVLSKERFLPAPAQGVVATQHRIDDAITAKLIAGLNHNETHMATTAERRFLQVMEGGCHMPLGALATVDDDTISLEGTIVSLDGSKEVRGTAVGTDGRELGERLATELRSQGGAEILEEIASCAQPNTIEESGAK